LNIDRIIKIKKINKKEM